MSSLLAKIRKWFDGLSNTTAIMLIGVGIAIGIVVVGYLMDLFIRLTH